jgi:hypothetical protein
VLADGVDALYLTKIRAVVAGELTCPDLTGFNATSTIFRKDWDPKDNSAKYDIIATINKEQQDKCFRLAETAL